MAKSTLHVYISDETRERLQRVAREHGLLAECGRKTGQPSMSGAVEFLALEAVRKHESEDDR